MKFLFAEKDKFSTFVIASIAAHASVVLIFTIKMTLFPSEDLLIQSAVRVDMVALPDKIKEATPKPAEQKPPEVKVSDKKPSESKPKKVPLKNAKAKAKERQRKALERLKALEAIEKLKEESKAAPTPPKPKEYKGNVLSAGSSLTGLDKIQFEAYFDKLQLHVKNHWDLPQWLANANLKAQVRVVIDKLGHVTDKEIVTSSNNEIFDAKVVQAIVRSSPYPPPPNRLAGVIATQGIIFNFP